MINLFKHWVKMGFDKLGVEIRLKSSIQNIDSPAQSNSIPIQPKSENNSGSNPADIDIDSILALLAYGLFKLLSLPREESDRLLELIRFNDPNGFSAPPNKECNAETIASEVEIGNICFKQGQFQETLAAYQQALGIWIQLVESGQLQESTRILQETLRTSIRESQCRPLDLLSVAVSLGIYSETGSVWEFAHQSKIQLHCQTNAYFNDFVSWLITTYRPPYETFKQGEGILGSFNSERLDAINSAINNGSYYIFPDRLPAQLCDRLTNFALTTPGIGYQQQETLPELVLYNRDNPQVDGCYIPEQDALDNSDIQGLATDPYFLAVAQRHLGAQPILANVSMWWSSAIDQSPNSAMAQLYHFDMDWLKWTNFFIYLTDVTTDTGPHCYIANTHHRQAKPETLLARRYVRIADRELQEYYPEEDFVEITGLRGTVIVGDTRCYHKAKPLKTGDRLMINITYANTLWLGGSYKQPILKSDFYNENLLTLAQTHPRIFSKFIKL
ncbi:MULTISPECIES: tetratricopeptide repeat protein [Spirulina sp. CCY15215]|uniref:phytanoyl-CoA dioxygenase family protein n=1 Tax=Spirulina sp. CCY15215 TaxID=2767591 RepID=UPI00194E1DC4